MVQLSVSFLLHGYPAIFQFGVKWDYIVVLSPGPGATWPAGGVLYEISTCALIFRRVLRPAPSVVSPLVVGQSVNIKAA